MHIVATPIYRSKINEINETYESFLPLNEAHVSKTYFGDIDSGPEKFEMFLHLGGLVFGIQDGQLCKHSHVGPFQTESGLQ